MATFPEGCAMIFGGHGGIGRGVAETFGRAGSDVALVYRSREEVAAQVAEAIGGAGRRVSTHRADVTDPAELSAAIRDAIATHGRIHTVVWGAGPLVNQRYLAETPMEEWRHAFEVEVHGFFATVQAVIPHMRAMGGGSFVHLGSAGQHWWPSKDGMSVAVKASNESLIHGIAKEEGKHGIRANSVLIGVIDAGQLHELTRQGQIGEKWVANTKRLLCIKRWGTPEEIAHAAIYFASNEAAYTTGQTIAVSGGLGV